MRSQSPAVLQGAGYSLHSRDLPTALLCPGASNTWWPCPAHLGIS